MYEIKLNDQVLHELDPDSYRRLSAGVLAEEVNQIPSFSFTIPAMNPLFSRELNDRTDIVTVTNMLTDEEEFEGPLLTHSKAMTSGGQVCKKAVAEGYLGYLRDSIQPYYHYESCTIAQFIEAVLAQHNAFMPESKRIYLGLCDFSGDNTNSKTTAYRNTLEEIEVNIIKRVGGEIRIRKAGGRLLLDFLHRIGTVCSTTVELAKNMKSLEVDTDSTNIITRLIPLGCQLAPGETAERLTIADVNGGQIYIDDTAAMAQYGVIVGTAEFDNITLPANLIAAGREYLANNNRVKEAYEGQALDLSVLVSSEQSLRCGNTYTFKNELLGLDSPLRLLGRRVDIYKPYVPTLRIGDKAARITDIASQTAQLIEYELPQREQSLLASARGIATDIINAGIEGHIVCNGNEFLIMDTTDKTTATKVWRWNLGGFGYSSNGYSGPYGTAITMDGSIIADFITAGVLRGLEITNGNGTFHVYSNGTVEASAINITGGSINISTNSESYDVIQLSCGDWTHKLSPLEWVLENAATGCKIRAQAGAIFFYQNGTLKMTLDTASGSLTANSVTADSILYKDPDSSGYYNVGNQIKALWDYVTGGA